MKHLRRAHLTLAVFIAGWLLIACATQSALPDLSAQQIKDRAAENMAALKSLHFAVDLTGRLTYIDPGRVLALKRAEGDISAPDRVKAVVRTRTFGNTTEISVVAVGRDQYARNPVSGQWETLPPEYGAFDIGALFNREVGIAGLLRDGTFDLAGQEAIEQRAHYLLTTTTPGQNLAPMTSGMITEGKVEAKLWIDGETFVVSQIQLVETETDPDEPTTWQIKLSAFDQPVDITPPIVP